MKLETNEVNKTKCIKSMMLHNRRSRLHTKLSGENKNSSDEGCEEQRKRYAQTKITNILVLASNK